MERFLQKHADRITGVLSGFDRLVLRGTLRSIAFVAGFKGFLWDRQILWKHFGDFAQEATERLKDATSSRLEALGRPLVYLPSARIDKEQRALEIARRDGVRDGTVCVLSAVEPCMTYEIRRDAPRKQIDIVARERKCLFFYHYAIHPRFGWINARIQTWLPFSVQICLNGREWLARSMDAAALDYERRDNCFVRVADFAAAQGLLDEQLRVDWPKELDAIARDLNPVQDEILVKPLRYYWSVHQSEWAADLAFADASSLQQVYRPLVHHGITSFSCSDVLRFLGRTGRFTGEVTSSLRERPEGLRLRHAAGENSLKIYDKQELVLRVETTINDPRGLRTYRAAEGDPSARLRHMPLRRGIADLYARAQASHACNERYLDALADVDTATPLGQLLDDLARPTSWKGRRVRGLRPFADDLALLTAVGRGEHLVHGLRNRDLQAHLFDRPAASPTERRRRCARVTRLLRLLRAHSLIRKLPHTHRYQLTSRGRELVAAVLATRRLTLEQINHAA